MSKTKKVFSLLIEVTDREEDRLYRIKDNLEALRRLENQERESQEKLLKELAIKNGVVGSILDYSGLFSWKEAAPGEITLKGGASGFEVEESIDGIESKRKKSL